MSDAIHAPCLMLDMPSATYHSIKALSAGGIKRMKQSPAHFYGLQLDPNRPPPSEKPAFVHGTLVHAALFEPDTLDVRYVIKPPGMKFTTKDGIAWRDANSDRVIVDADEMAGARAQAAAVRALPDVAALLSEGFPEASAFWVDELTGELCKCRPDFVSPAGDGVIIVDGKTAIDASPDGFGRAIWNWGYHLGAAWYTDGYEKATGKRVHGYVFAAVENAWPHAAAAYMLGEDALDKARAECRRLLNLYADCKRTGVWPGYQTQIMQIDLPRWANFKDAE